MKTAKNISKKYSNLSKSLIRNTSVNSKAINHSMKPLIKIGMKKTKENY
jgi:hypothetical protein